MSMIVDIYTPAQYFGVKHDADVITRTIKGAFKDLVKVRQIFVPLQYYKTGQLPESFFKTIEFVGDLALSIERPYSADFFNLYKARSLYINPEWFNAADQAVCEEFDVSFLHKSQHYFSSLKEKLPKNKHIYTGFTSIDPLVSVKDYSTFTHFRGKSTRRLSQNLIDIWQQKPSLPLLRLQAYGNDVSINTNAWAVAGNIHFYFGRMDRTQYLQEVAQGGIHLCTAQVEGFGHFINEARAMSALTIALDAPPMNELITKETGILVPAKAVQAQGFGMIYVAEQKDLVQAIDHAQSLSIPEREQLGRNARELYENQSASFRRSLVSYIQTVIDDISTGAVKPTTVKLQSAAAESEATTSLGLTFDNIYSKKLWGKSSESPQDVYSGLGSHDEAIVGPYVAALSDFFSKFDNKLSAVDVGCGDFAVGRRIRHLFDNYTACDVSKVVIEAAKSKHSDSSVDFRHLDATSEELPRGDVVLIRQVLQHLDNRSIKKIVENFNGKYQYAVITEHLPLATNFSPNVDKPSGPDIRLSVGSGIILSEAPFLMSFKKATELLAKPQFGGRIVTTLYEL